MELYSKIRWSLLFLGGVFVSIYPLFANFLVTPEEILRLEFPSNVRNQIRFCKQNPIQVYGKNPIGSGSICVTVLEGEVAMESFFAEELEETSETQWSFYDSVGKQIFPSVSWEGSEPMVFVSLVRSKRGQFGVQLQRKKEGAYYFYRTKLSNWVIL
ncbi:hypothetical protein [Leptospira biflexa]|uniref:hypothetical protein n=1 Tax=Leptospira biflexa TaxID=172 RepID=UPI0010832B85|nr:hypothetical protein [Leptospira biflexa]TGM38051.1 hypothetical protein EHQ80_10825 [Leptospira biflexa]TGM41383.1 hypothetical protein EHQ89_05390 [Leptospira biflexa]